LKWNITKEPLTILALDAIIVFHFEDCEATQDLAKSVDKELNFRISSLISEGEITGRFGEVTIIHNFGIIPSNRVIVIGLGKEKDVDLRVLKNAIAIGARRAQNIKLKQLGLSPPAFLNSKFNSVDIIQAIVEGIEIGTYKHQVYKKDKKEFNIDTIWISLTDFPLSAAQVGVERGQVFSSATNLARFLVFEPCNILTPLKLAQVAVDVGNKRGLKVEVLDENQIESLGMGALLAVASGSHYPPRVIVMSYEGAKDSKDILCFVGKGITFDSGGLQIKPGNKMVDMKGDMAGAASVIGAMDAIGKLKPNCNVMGIVVTCENAVGSRSYRPGDVLKSFSGKYIEITHTDAEGRLILADGILYAKSLGATKLVDIATLTGAVVVALGNETTGLMTNNEEWGNEVKIAARIAGEKVWELPMFEEYKEYLKSDIADIKNNGGVAGAIYGAMFLSQFAEDTPWVHLDIAGTSETDKESGIYIKGPTGESVRTLIQLAIRFA